jgi:dopamine receptor D1
MNNSSLPDPNEIVLNIYGDVYNPVDIKDKVLIFLKFVCCIIGIPLNVSIAVTIIRHRRLYRKPRNIFLLGIIFSYLAFFVPAIIELIYWGMYQDDSVCEAYVAVVSLPHFLLLWNMLLALADRFVAINYPLLHREKMTVCLASCVVCFSSISLPFLLKFVYTFRLIPLRCVMWIVLVKFLLIVLAVLFVLCTALNVVVYRKTKALLRETRTLHPPFTDVVQPSHFRSVEVSSRNNLIQRASTNMNENSAAVAVRPMSVHVDRRKINRIEMEATLTLILGVTSLLVTFFPYFVCFFLYRLCRLLIGSQSECSNFNWISPYLIEMGLINAVYSPLIFLIRNRELWKLNVTC